MKANFAFFLQEGINKHSSVQSDSCIQKDWHNIYYLYLQFCIIKQLTVVCRNLRADLSCASYLQRRYNAQQHEIKEYCE